MPFQQDLKEKMFVWLLNGLYQCITVDNATVQRAMIFAVSFRSPDVFILALDYCRNGTAAKLNAETTHLLTWKWRLFLIGFSWKHSAAKLVIRVCKGRISEMAWSQWSRRLERWMVLRIRCFSSLLTFCQEIPTHLSFPSWCIRCDLVVLACLHRFVWMKSQMCFKDSRETSHLTISVCSIPCLHDFNI